MSFKFIDYSATYFTTIAKKPIPSKRGGKFVQIINHATNDEYLVLSPKELSVYHANIVERFCLLNGNIPGSHNAKKDFFEIQNTDWQVIGGGFWSIDEKTKTLTLGGESKMYGAFDRFNVKSKIAIVV
jgi:hypothetical protein